MPAGEDVIVEMSDDDADQPEFDTKGNILRIEHGDGSVTVSLDGSPIDEAQDDKPSGWFDNLVEEIDDSELGRVADDLLRGIDADNQSRQEWIEARTQGIKLLGLKIEIPGLQGASDGAPVEGMSKVRHPLLLEAVLRFQANARSELLPTDGPLKIRNDDNNATVPEDRLADCLERDANHYLTSTATEYYPDTDRMLLMLGFGGTSFKKVYFCPLRNRPVSESVDANDLIVSNDATDLRNAKRITHRVSMKPSTVKRMQILGVYRDVELSTPLPAKLNSVDREKADQQGVTPESSNPEDRDRELYECYCELDLKGFEHKHKGKTSGLEIPYRVTIDVSSREILSIVRNYNEDTKELPEARVTFVKYTFVPGLGFYDIGLLHILGNTTNALTAAWREMLDNGMYANFPGFLFSDAGGRQNSNIFRVPPGGGAQIKTGGMPISQFVAPLPYNTSGQAALQSLAGDMATTGMRIGGTSEQQVGEGRADAPVGTTLAMIEQATKVMNSVHKRMHASQSEEFALILDCFREHPDSFWQRKGRSGYSWDEQTFLKALDDIELVPVADPNTASHTQRMMKVQALVQAATAAPTIFNVPLVQKTALEVMGWANPEQFINSTPQPDAKTIQAQSDAKNDATRAQADMITAQAKAEEIRQGLGAAQHGQQPAPPNPIEIAKLQMKRQELAQDRQEDMMEAENRERDRESKERIESMDFIRDVMANPQGLPIAERLMEPGFLHNLESNEQPIEDQSLSNAPDQQ